MSRGGRRPRFAAVFLLMLAWAPASIAVAFDPAASGALEFDNLRWRSLVYESERLLTSLETRIELSRVSAASVQWMPMPQAHDPLHAPQGETLLRLNAWVKARAGVTTLAREDSVWFEPDSARVLQQIRFAESHPSEQKLYRFNDDNIFRLRRAPSDRSEIDRIALWSDREESAYPSRTRDGAACPLFVESATLLYVVSAMDRKQFASPWTLCVFSRKRLYPVTISTPVEESLQVDFEVTVGSDSQRRQGALKARVFEVTVNPRTEHDISADAFTFLGLRAPIRFLMDEASGVPVRVDGRLPKIGSIELDLRAVRLQNSR